MCMKTLEIDDSDAPTDVHEAIATSSWNALDDKIELNRRMNETLEATARAIFKDWFVDFGPTHAQKPKAARPTSPPNSGTCSPTRWTMRASRCGWEEQLVAYRNLDIVGGGSPSD